jgi:hypothetical protein
LRGSKGQKAELKLSQDVRNKIKKIPGTTFVFDVSWKSFLALRILAGVLFSKIRLWMNPPFRYRRVAPKASLVAITVSTNYSDLLEICLESNYNWFDKWIVITQESDARTRDVLAKHPEVRVLFWDPRKAGAVFDKGSGVQIGQRYAYEMFPNSWYLLIDSDIVLEGLPFNFVDSLNQNSPQGLYGIERWDYKSIDDLKSKTNSKKYIDSEKFHGYFQLYSTPYLYTRSKDAGLCDLKFKALFRKREILMSPRASHLGQESHWRGRPAAPDDFKN